MSLCCRPVQLHKWILVGNKLYDSDKKELGTVNCKPKWNPNETEPCAVLAQETLTNGHSVLIFCCSKWVSPNSCPGGICLCPVAHALSDCTCCLWSFNLLWVIQPIQNTACLLMHCISAVMSTHWDTCTAIHQSVQSAATLQEYCIGPLLRTRCYCGGAQAGIF